MNTEVKEIKQLAFPFQVIEEELMNPLAGQEMSEVELFISTLLLEATSEEPIKMRRIIDIVQDAKHETLTPRKVKLIIRSLRRDRGFPILTRRSKPAGYFWCRSEKELKGFENMWLKQVMDELVTLQLIKKRNYPRLAGQKILYTA